MRGIAAAFGLIALTLAAPASAQQRATAATVSADATVRGVVAQYEAALIRQRPKSQHTPIIFVTAFGDDAHAFQGYSLGAVDYILTPVVPAG